MKRSKKKEKGILSTDFFPELTPEFLKKSIAERRAEADEEKDELLDSYFEDLYEMIGRKLEESEEEEFLDVVDEFTPTGKDGKYLVDLCPFDYAWAIYQARKRRNAK